ncbi:hypothetical protein CSW58_03530 [Caulobacter sp. B11]|uniref:hypothetical protein n=1 Tax=Caulobacter sp. B11 TaxID=2048899 RepID=UPI000C12A23D|nr:hypothetical protein [Caulobacter sp. B11]PHY13783.1 hypothetical protein CSW58_03530 [Caulobacter sp. B11]
MTQISIIPWSQALQAKLMAAIDAAWKTIEDSDNPLAVRKARDKAKACGEIAAVVRKIVAMAGLKPVPGPAAVPIDPAPRALDRLKGGRRGRL